MVIVNITFNGRTHQRGNVVVPGASLANIGRADGHQRHRQGLDGRTAEVLVGGCITVPGSHLRIACSGANYSQPGDFIDAVPARQAAPLVVADQQVQVGTRLLGGDFVQGVHGVARACAADFAVVHLHLRQAGKRQPRHGQAVGSIGQRSRAVPGLPGGQDPYFVELHGLDGRLNKRHMRPVRRVERPAKHADVARGAHTQSRGTRKWLSRRASGEPAGSWRW